MSENEPSDLDLAVRMRQMLYGQLLSRTLCAVAALDIPDILADAALGAEELAAKAGAQPDTLRQVLRALIPFGVFDEDESGAFRLTRLGATLRTDAEASALPTALLVHGEVGRSWNDFLVTMRTGETAFGQLYGTDFFSHLDDAPALRATFHQSQQHGLTLDLAGILRNLDFSEYKVLVDVGGGDGALLESVLAANPGMSGVLLDLPTVVAQASVRFAAAGLAERVELCGGDFFKVVPEGGDLYLLRQITHDLDDARCVELLSACRAAMDAGSTLMVMDIVTDGRAGGGPAAEMSSLMDLYMMSIFGGRERSRAEFERLLGSAGFALRSVLPVSGHMAAILADPA